MSTAEPTTTAPAEPSSRAGTVGAVVAGVAVLETAEAFRSALVALRTRAVLAVATLWKAMVSVDRLARIGDFGTLAALVVEAAQRQGVALAALHASGILRTPPSGIDPGRFVGNPSTSAPLPAVLASSSIYVRHALATGHDEAVALERGLHRATRITSTEVTRAGTDALAELARDTSGWRRVTGPSPCAICAGLADGTVNRWDEAVSAHPHCSCVQEVVTD